GGSISLSRTDSDTGYTVETTSALGRVRTYEVERLPDGGLLRAVTDAAGLRTQLVFATNGSRTTTFPNGTLESVLIGPDPRWGMQAPVIANSMLTMPSGLSRTLTQQRTAVLADPDDLLSLVTQTETLSINGRHYTNTYT